MHSIVIKFGDNDFGNTFQNLLDTIYRAIDENNRKPFSEFEIIDLIKKGILFHYIAFQNQYRYACTEENLKSTEEYLLKFKVLFDEEADEFYKTGWQNSECVYLHIESGFITTF